MFRILALIAVALAITVWAGILADRAAVLLGLVAVVAVPAGHQFWWWRTTVAARSHLDEDEWL